MKLLRKAGATGQIFQVFVRDSASTTGGGLTGLAFGTAGLTAYYHRDTDTAATAITLVTMTVGTFTSSGFKEVDATNMPGWYQLCPPNAALASGAASVAFHLKGAANMAPLPVEVDLDAQADVTHWSGTAVASPATAGVPEVNVTQLSGSAAAAALLAALYSAFESGTAQAGGSSTVTLRAGASAANDSYKDQVVFVTGGTGAGQTNRITGYAGSTKIATVETPWVVQPDATSAYVVLGRVG